MGVQGVEYKEEYDLYDIILDHLLDEKQNCNPDFFKKLDF
jgi:hypothetical protein